MSQNNDSSSSSSSPNNDSTSVQPIDGVAYSSNLGDRHELTLFQDQGTSNFKESRDNYAPAPRSGLDESYLHSIASFLARPHRLRVFPISTTTDYIGTLTLTNFFAELGIANKIANFRFYNADMIVKIVANASRYALGRALVTHIPMNDILAADRALPNAPVSVQLLTSYPHAEVDFGSSESVTFRVPYCDIVPWRTLDSSFWSRVRFDMINPLVGTTSGETATLSVFVWVENLQLSIPTTQGFTDEPDAKSKSLIAPSNQTSRLISGALQHRPLMKELTDGVAWASALAVKAASLFGMSKPMNTSPNTPFSNVPCRGFTQCEGSSESVSLSFRPSNGICSNPSLDLSKEDPMNINHFLSRSQIFEIIPWNVGEGSDTQIFNRRITSIVTATSTFLTGIVDLYNFYRGGLVFRLSAVKNAFYSGRLAVQFYPDGAAETIGWDPNSPSLIWDVQENREIYFSVPYQSIVRMVEGGLTSQFLGRLVIYVLNPLRADVPLPQTLSINMSVMAASDFSLSVPQNKTRIYTQGLTDSDAPPSTSKRMESIATPLLAISPTDSNTEAIIMGEPTFSLKDLIKRYTYYSSISTQAFTMDPHWFGTLASTNPIDNLSRYYRFARGSRRYMVVMSSPPLDASGNPPPFSFLNANLVKNGAQPLDSPVAIPTPPRSANFEHRVDSRLNAFIEVNVPYYSNTDRFVIGGTNESFSAWMMVRFWASYDELVYTTPPTWDIYVAVGDDFSFSFPCHLPFQL